MPFFTPVSAPYTEQAAKGAMEPFVDLIRELVEQGKPIPPIPIIIEAPTATDKILDAVGNAAQLATSPQTFNSGITFFSVRTAGRSAIGFLHTQDQVSKTFYVLGFIFAGTAAGFATSATLSEACSVSKVGMVSEGIAEACYRVAEEANKLALERDKKIIPVRKPIFRRNPGSAAFIIPSSNRSRVYTIVISNVIFIVTVYGYIKIIRTTWKKARGIILKKRKFKKLKLFMKFMFISILINKTRKSKMTPRLSCNKSCLFSAV